MGTNVSICCFTDRKGGVMRRLLCAFGAAAVALSLTSCGFGDYECGQKDNGVYVPCEGETTTSFRPSTVASTSVTPTTSPTTTPSTPPSAPSTTPTTQTAVTTVHQHTVYVVPSTTVAPTTPPPASSTQTAQPAPAPAPAPAPPAAQSAYADMGRVVDCGGLLVLDGETVTGNDGTRVTRAGGLLSFSSTPTYPITEVILGEFSGYPTGLTNANIGTGSGQTLTFSTNYSGPVTICST